MCGNMVSSCKMSPWLMAICCLVMADCTNVTDQETSESQHDQVAILKQIRKVNDDGTYVFGYEAGDGSFKVETRDVVGNVRGTFGFVNENGEIKRVTYTSSNGTGFKSTTLSPLQEQASVVQSIPRSNRSSTRKPTVVYATSTESSSSTTTSAGSKSNVVQAIPRLRKQSTSTTTTTTTTTPTSPTTDSSKPLFGHYLKSSKNRPKFFINGQQRPSAVSSEEGSNEDSQLTRPSTEEKPNPRKIIFPKRPIDHTLRPITEEFEEKDEESKATTGNALRRQLHEETTKPERSQEVNNDEHSDVYGAALSTTRPLFTTSSPPKIIQRIRAERPKMLYQVTPPVQENLGPARFDNTKYEAETKSPEERDSAQSVVYQSVPARIPERDYPRQTTTEQPIYVRRDQEQILRDLSAGILVPVPNPEEDYRSAPVGRVLFRPQSRAPVYPTTPVDPGNVQYLTESPPEENVEPLPPPPPPQRGPPQGYLRPRPYPRPYAEPRQPLRPVVPVDDREYPEYYRNIALPPEPPNPIAPPLSRRDFQMLLRRLLISQYGPQALVYPRTYLEDALYDQQPYPSYQTNYQMPVRAGALYDSGLRYGDRPVRPVVPRVPISNLDPGMYPQRYPEDYQDSRYMKRAYRQKFYNSDMNEESDAAGDEILPPPIREALLLRMLQLAISNDRPAMQNMMVRTTGTGYRKSPVRSVQIITDDQDKDVMKKI